MNNTYQVVTLKEKPELKEVINQLHSTGWVKFMREDPVAIRYWDDLLDWFPEFQFVLLNSSGSPMACGNSIPFCWNDTPDNLPSGWDGVFEQGIADYKIGVESNFAKNERNLISLYLDVNKGSCARLIIVLRI